MQITGDTRNKQQNRRVLGGGLEIQEKPWKNGRVDMSADQLLDPAGYIAYRHQNGLDLSCLFLQVRFFNIAELVL